MRHGLSRRGLLQGALALSANVLSIPGRGFAGTYPARTIKLLAGAPAGSAPDVLARVFAEALAANVGQSVVVENRPGPGGIAAMQALIGSEPDGYTIGLATMNQLIFDSYLFASLPYDPRGDLAPITLLGSNSNAIAVAKSFAADNFAELIATARARPIKLNVGTALPGTPPQIFAHVLAHIAGIEVSYVAYRSGLDAMAALLRGEIQVLVDAPVIMLPEVQAGAIKILVVSSHEREHELPAVPTLSEAGYPAAESRTVGRSRCLIARACGSRGLAQPRGVIGTCKPKDIKFIAHGGRQRAAIVRRAKRLHKAWESNNRSVGDLLYRANIEDFDFMLWVKSVADGNMQDIGAVTALAAKATPRLSLRRGPKISAASATHEFFLTDPLKVMRAPLPSPGPQRSAEYVDALTQATRTEFKNPDFDPRPARQRSKASGLINKDK